MMKGFLLGTACLLLFACGGRTAKNRETGTELNAKDRVEVLYFHGKQRCATCMAIEKNAAETVETLFADEAEKGTVVFRSVDISAPENERLADDYEVAWSSLFVNRWRDGKETRENLTEFAFANARTAPDTFRSGLVKKITNALNVFDKLSAEPNSFELCRGEKTCIKMNE